MRHKNAQGRRVDTGADGYQEPTLVVDEDGCKPEAVNLTEFERSFDEAKSH